MILTKTRKIVIVVIIAGIVLLGGYFVFKKDRGTSTNPSLVTNNATTTGGGISTGANTGNYTIEQDNMSGLPKPIPDLNRPVRPAGSATVSSDAIVLATQKIVLIQGALKKNPANFNDWLNLGMYQKMAGDYEGAVISWQYASKLAPGDYISLGNIANLYAYFIKDNTKAESYYKQAVVKDPKQAYLYIQLAGFYKDVMHDSAKEVATIDAGLKVLPDDSTLLQLKANP